MTCKMLVVECYNAIKVYNLTEKGMKACPFMLDKGVWLVVECHDALKVYNLPEKGMKAYTFMLDKGMWLVVECKKVEKAYRLFEKVKLICAKVKVYNFTEKVEEAGNLAEKTSITLGKMEKVYMIFKKLVKYFF